MECLVISQRFRRGFTAAEKTELWERWQRGEPKANAARNLQTTVPNNLPIPAVRAIANAPQNVTRTVARRIFAPPTFAPIAPRRARKPKDAVNTIGTSAPVGDTTTISKGIAAPTVNDAAEASAACTGRAVVVFEIPSSSRAGAPKASFALSCWATCRAST